MAVTGENLLLAVPRVPGAFSAALTALLSARVSELNELGVASIDSIELSENPFVEQLELTLSLTKSTTLSPVVYFTASGDRSAAENFEELLSFLRGHAGTARTAPQLPKTSAVGLAGD
jgi:hypothetical protein